MGRLKTFAQKSNTSKNSPKATLTPQMPNKSTIHGLKQFVRLPDPSPLTPPPVHRKPTLLNVYNLLKERGARAIKSIKNL